MDSSVYCKPLCKYRFLSFIKAVSSVISLVFSGCPWGGGTAQTTVRGHSPLTFLWKFQCFFAVLPFKPVTHACFRKAKVNFFHKLNYIVKIHLGTSLFKSCMTNQQVVGLLLKSSLSGEPLCFRVSLHMVGCACVPCKPLRSTLRFPVASVHASVNLPRVLY